MKKRKLGLPLEYKKLPEYFDAVNIQDDTDAKNSVIEKLLATHNVKKVLDLTCGTGSQVFFLNKMGYECVGSDFSPRLIEIAREKALKKKLNVRFINGDMRTVNVGTFDAVITIFNAIGHLTKAGFQKALTNIARNLKPGGIYVFDILNSEAMNKDSVAGLSYQVHKKIGDTQILLTQCSTFDEKASILTSYNSYMTQRKAEAPEIFKSKFSLQLYSGSELQKMLAKTGFKTAAQYALDGSQFIPNKTMSILTVAMKK